MSGQVNMSVYFSRISVLDPKRLMLRNFIFEPRNLTRNDCVEAYCDQEDWSADQRRSDRLGWF